MTIQELSKKHRSQQQQQTSQQGATTDISTLSERYRNGFPTQAPQEHNQSLLEKVNKFFESTPVQNPLEAAGSTLLGAAKGVGSTIFGLGELGAKGLGAITGTGYTPLEKPGFLKPKNAQELAGYLPEQIAEFFLPGNVAIKAGETVSKAVKAPKIIKGAAGLATMSGLEAGITGGITAIQGGTEEDIKWAAIIGAAVPPIIVAGKAIYGAFKPNAAQIISKRTATLNKIEDSKSSLRNYVAKQSQRGLDPKSDIAATDLLVGSVDNTGTIRTLGDDGAVAQYTAFIKPQEKIVSKILEKEGTTIPLSEVQTRMVQAINESGMKGASRTEAFSKIEKELQGYAMDADKLGNIPIAEIHIAKIDKYANINYLNESGRTDKIIAKTLKEIVEEFSQNPNIQALNRELSRHYANIGYLEKLNGAKVEGGRLGKHFARILGGIAGAHFGPLGTVVGSELAGGIKGAQMGATFAGKTGKVLEASPKMIRALKEVQSSKSLGSLKAIQSKTIIPIKNPISESIPQSGLIGQKKITDPVNFERAKVLNTEHRALETKAFDYITKNEDSILTQYKEKYGKFINADNFRPFLKPAGYVDGSLAAGVQEPVSYLAKRARTEALKNPGDYAVGTAGGSGVGKTTAAKGIPKLVELQKNAAMILDSNFSNIDSARKFIKEVESAGKKFVGVFTYRDFMDSLENGIVKRMLTNKEEMGRLVPNSVTAGNHIGSWDVIRQLVSEGVRFRFVDNSLGAGKAKLVSLDELVAKIKYPPKDELTAAANKKVRDLYESGQKFVDNDGVAHTVTKKQYDALIE